MEYPHPTSRRNYLLVMPRLVQNVGDGYSFPLGIVHISSSLKAAGFRVHTLNLNHREGTVGDILAREIEQNAIDVIATGGLSFQFSTVKAIIDAAKTIKPEIITIVGGGIITGDPEPAMEALEHVDVGVIGEGEVTACELCQCIEDDGDLANVDGIIYRRNGTWQRTRERKEIADIDQLPWPDYEGFEIGKYLDLTPPGISGLNAKRTVFMLASRSCPYLCTFCFHTIGRKYRQRSMDAFFKELDYLVSKYQIDFVCLADELFARSLDRVKEFCHRIKAYNIQWWAQFRVDDVTPELIETLKQGGCGVMVFGLESADNRVLKSMRKAITIEQTEAALKLVYDAGISVEGSFIFGDLEETVETAANTLKWWREHAHYRISINLINVYPGSYLYEVACKRGIIQDRVAFLRDGCPQINVSKMSAAEMSDLLKQLMEAPVTLTETLDSPEVVKINGKSGSMAIRGVCKVCHEPNLWENMRLFTMNFLPCKACGQKYNLPLMEDVRRLVEANLQQLVDRYGRIAIWGVNYHIYDLFKESPLLRGPHVIAVDASNTKRQMDLHGKQILPPSAIRDQRIQAVVIGIPVYYSQIHSIVCSDYPGVQAYDLSRLIDPEFQP